MEIQYNARAREQNMGTLWITTAIAILDYSLADIYIKEKVLSIFKSLFLKFLSKT